MIIKQEKDITEKVKRTLNHRDKKNKSIRRNKTKRTRSTRSTRSTNIRNSIKRKHMTMRKKQK